jgi:hypothetical protein
VVPLGVDKRNDFALPQDAEVCGFTRLFSEPLNKRPRQPVEVEARQGHASKFNQLQTEPVLGGIQVTLNQPVTLEHGEQSMHSTLAHLETLAQFGWAKAGLARRERIQDCHGAVEYLYPVFSFHIA